LDNQNQRHKSNMVILDVVLETVPGRYVEITQIGKLVLLELDFERDLMANKVQLKLNYFDHMVRGSMGEVALTAMKGAMEGIYHSKRSSKETVAG